MNLIEQRIWDLLDGNATGEERTLTEQLIESNPDYRKVYEEFKSFNSLVSTVELDEPSMSFCRNVMDQIQMEPVSRSVKSLIDKRIIYGIMTFFLLTITILLGFLLSQIDWSQPTGLEKLEYKFPVVNIFKSLNDTLINIFFFSYIIIGLYFLDGFLRRKLLISKNIS